MRKEKLELAARPHLLPLTFLFPGKKGKAIRNH